MRLKKAFVRLPESDGGIPFSALLQFDNRTLIVAGILGGVLQTRAIESTVSDLPFLELVKTQSSLLTEIDYGVFLYFLNQVSKIEHRLFDEAELLLLAGNICEPSFRNETIELEMEKAASVSTLMTTELGAFFELPKVIVENGIKGIILALNNDEQLRDHLLEAVIETCADEALDMELRLKWCIALELMAHLHQNINADAYAAALHNMRAMELGKHGRDIPFVYAWTNQQLQNTVAIAQLMAGQNSKETVVQDDEHEN